MKTIFALLLAGSIVFAQDKCQRFVFGHFYDQESKVKCMMDTDTGRFWMLMIDDKGSAPQWIPISYLNKGGKVTFIPLPVDTSSVGK